MLFLVISSPASSKISKELIQARLAFRDWIRRLKKKVKCFYPRKGRGAAVIIEVDSRKELRGLLREWTVIVRAGFDVYPLEYPKKAEAALHVLLGAPAGRAAPGKRQAAKKCLTNTLNSDITYSSDYSDNSKK